MGELVLLTGMSGAGKSTAIFVFEELNYQCIENPPIELLHDIFKLVKTNPKYEKTMIALPLQEAALATELVRLHPEQKVTIIGLIASTKELLSRFKLTRHIHPLQTKGLTLDQAIDLDRANYEEIRSSINMLIDTTSLSVNNFRERLMHAFRAKGKQGPLLSFVSFGYKYGIPSDADLVLDARVLPNPFWEEKLKPLTGLDGQVSRYVLESKQGQAWLNEAQRFLSFIVDQVSAESRPYYVVGIGCTGGQHRSVAIAEYLKKNLSKTNAFDVNVVHRDLEKKGE